MELHQGSVMSFFFKQLWWILSLFVKRGCAELRCADNLVLMSETIEGLKNMFIK